MAHGGACAGAPVIEGETREAAPIGRPARGMRANRAEVRAIALAEMIVADRALLRALPNLHQRMLALEEGARAAVAVRRAVSHLEAGGALLHFPAGRIEPDPARTAAGEPLLFDWRPGVDTLVRAGL